MATKRRVIQLCSEVNANVHEFFVSIVSPGYRFEPASDVHYSCRVPCFSNFEKAITYHLALHEQRRCAQSCAYHMTNLRPAIDTKDPAAALVGACMLSGLTNATIKYIIENYSTMESADQLQECGVTSHKYAVLVLKVISDFCNTSL